MLETMGSVFSAIILLGVLILVHEFGHFAVARLCGVRVEKFSIGFGPEIWGGIRGDTRYVVSWIPLGGFVKLAGESQEGLEGREPRVDDYISKNVWQRISIVVAGPFMNIFTALIALTVVFSVGRLVPKSIIGEFVEGYPAIHSGLQVGDTITSINSQSIAHWGDLLRVMFENEKSTVDVEVQREGEVLTYNVSTNVDQLDQSVQGKTSIRRLGIKPDMKNTIKLSYPVSEAFVESVKTLGDWTVQISSTLWQLVSFQSSVKELRGPVYVFSESGKVAKQGLSAILDWAAIISFSLGFFNILPIPALDGGHLIFLLMEVVRGRPMPPIFQERATFFGIVCLLLLMGVVTVNDIMHLDLVSKLSSLFGGG